ncbi:hypothetical protein [Dyadobacter sp. NIV53]|uniref:hypothetical protein n=1 Tax=Dyadobacter sp. NIV53 TaxID=2861765 RepID=UPI001C87E474|nr:hypothetical protein [Dyadobacter sp. NIV53]
MKSKDVLNQAHTVFSRLLILAFTMILFSCKRDERLDKIVMHENPFLKTITKPEILLDDLNNPATPVFIDNRIVFAESGKGTISEFKDKEAVPLITGFGMDSYGGYPISVLGLAAIPDKKTWIVAASQDSGHIFIYDEAKFPTTADKGREIEIQRTESINPFGILLPKKTPVIVATGGTKSVYQGNLDVINPNPMKPVFDVTTGVEGLAEDLKTGEIYGAVVGTGQNDGYLISWNPVAKSITPRTVARGFSNLVGVAMMPNRLLLLLEFGNFGKPESGRLSVIDLDKDPAKSYPLISGLDFPSGLSLGPDNALLISTFGKKPATPDGMLLKLKLEMKD